MAGLYFEDFKVGQEFAHPLTRTVTEMDNTLFSLMTLNPQPLHIDAHFSATTEFGQRLFNSLYTLGIMIGMTVYETTMGTTVANLGMTDVNFPKPVFHGDTLRATTKVISVREFKVAAECRHRRIRTRGAQSEKRGRRDVPPYGADAQKARLMRSMLFVPGDVSTGQCTRHWADVERSRGHDARRDRGGTRLGGKGCCSIRCQPRTTARFASTTR